LVQDGTLFEILFIFEAINNNNNKKNFKKILNFKSKNENDAISKSAPKVFQRSYFHASLKWVKLTHKQNWNQLSQFLSNLENFKILEFRGIPTKKFTTISKFTCS